MDIDNVPNLPTYEKPKERVPAALPATLTVKHPNTLNRLIGKMLKPQMRRMQKSPTGKRNKKHKFY
jgi:hypothetical protein